MKRQHIRRSLTYFIAIFILFSLVFAGIAAADSKEALLLAGVVKTIDTGGRSVVIDVTNKGCHGMMTFNIYNIEKYGIAKGDRVNFMIDSVTCPGSAITTITDLAKVVPMHWRIKK